MQALEHEISKFFVAHFAVGDDGCGLADADSFLERGASDFPTAVEMSSLHETRKPGIPENEIVLAASPRSAMPPPSCNASRGRWDAIHGRPSSSAVLFDPYAAPEVDNVFMAIRDEVVRDLQRKSTVLGFPGGIESSLVARRSTTGHLHRSPLLAQHIDEPPR